MAERSQYQYQQVVGPVWREPVAEKLAWLPSIQQPARTLSPNRLGDFALSLFPALYKPEGLQWLSSDRYVGHALAPNRLVPSALDPFPLVAFVYDPSTLEWISSGRQPTRALSPNRLGDFTSPAFESLYKPSDLAWIPSDRYAGRQRDYALTRYVVIDPIPPVNPAWLSWFPRDSYFGKKLPSGNLDYTVAPPFESLYKSEGLQSIPSTQQPGRSLSPNKLGDFQQPPFDSLYKPAGLQWFPSWQSLPRTLPPNRLVPSSFDPFPIAGPAYDPSLLDWWPRGAWPQVPIERRRLGDFQQPSFSALYAPEGLQWVASDRYAGRLLAPRYLIPSLLDPFPRPSVFDPQTLDWMPRGVQPRLVIEVRKIGDFQQPSFDALYKPEFLQWLFVNQRPILLLQPTRIGEWVIDPTITSIPPGVLRMWRRKQSWHRSASG